MKRSPQEKKALSYARDRRNAYGENDKASRISIPRAKARANRANRHRDQQLLAAAKGAPDDAVEEAVEDRVLGKTRVRWKKMPDVPLGEYLRLKRRRDG